MPDFTVAIAMLKKPIEDMFAAATGAIKEKISQLKTSHKVAGLHKRLWETQRVKTIWQTERPTSLNSFFYPVNIIQDTDSGSVSMRMTSISDLPHRHNIVFGTVGQGKSILMRYLLGREIKSGISIPVFCELRNLENRDLEQYLSERFSLLLNTANDINLFRFFAQNGKLSLFLDGFDEVDPSNIYSIMLQIEDIASKYSACRILLSSRPDSECKHLTSFHTVRISPLSDSDLAPFYKKITKDQEFTERIMAAIRTSPLQIRDLVNTPLLATLLAISYRAAHKIPLDFAEFYEELFQILLVRHDGSKMGWRRSRKTKLNDREIQQVFEAFCFATKKNKQLSMKREAACKVAEDSLKNCQFSADPTHLLEDIKKITCLLTEEGKVMDFVHASVQEFFAAKYIKSRPDLLAKKIYTQFLNGKWSEWQETLLFLQQIDAHRANKYFFVPDIEKTLTYYLGITKSANDEIARKYLEEQSVHKVNKDDRKPHYTVIRNRGINTYHLESVVDARVFSFLFSPRSNAISWHYGFIKNPNCTSRTFIEIARDRGGDVEQDLIRSVISTMNSLSSEKTRLSRSITLESASTEFTDI